MNEEQLICWSLLIFLSCTQVTQYSFYHKGKESSHAKNSKFQMEQKPVQQSPTDLHAFSEDPRVPYNDSNMRSTSRNESLKFRLQSNFLTVIGFQLEERRMRSGPSKTGFSMKVSRKKGKRVMNPFDIPEEKDDEERKVSLSGDLTEASFIHHEDIPKQIKPIQVSLSSPWNSQESKDVPLLVKNRVFGTETCKDDTERYRRDIERRPNHLEADKGGFSVDLEDFGLAMLLGMNWKPGDPVGKSNAKVVLPQDPNIRPNMLGLGANVSEIPEEMLNVKRRRRK